MNGAKTLSPHRLNHPVFWGAAALVLSLVSYAALFPDAAEVRFQALQISMMDNVGWFYVMAVALILLCVLFLGLSRYGTIKLGPDHALPDFSFSSWFAMLFSAGMGIGLMFFGVGEPLMHLLSPPGGSDPGSVEAAKEAMRITFFHWGLHAWAIYALVALVLAFFRYRHGLPLTLRSALYPLIGDRIYGWPGHLIDICGITGTVFGVATALGYGALQVNSGLHDLFGVQVGTRTQGFIIAAITLLATASVTSGLNRGIRRLSELNLLLALVLLLLVVVLGPTVLLLKMLVQNTGGYLSGLVDKTFNLYAYEPSDWLGGWTLFYWAWWLSWSPFVGMFIARISRGRTIREFVFGVLCVPSGMTFIWMTVFGNTSIELVMHQGADVLASTVQQDVSLVLFRFLEHFPLSSVLSCLSMAMVVVFFVTSSDSSAMVIDILASGGDSPTPLWQKAFWSFVIGSVAMVLMLAGGLRALQTATMATALPFCIILLFAAYGLLKALAIDAAKRDSQLNATLAPNVGSKPIPWQRRLKNQIHFPRKKQVELFVKTTVVSAMEAVAREFDSQNVVGIRVEIDEESLSPKLQIMHGDERDFLYQVFPRPFLQPSFMLDSKGDEERRYYRAEVFLSEGGQDYDLVGWTQDQIIADIVDQYEKHMHFLHMVR